jgi:hypothetical protein
MLRVDVAGSNGSWRNEKVTEQLKISSDKLLFLNECSSVYEEAVSIFNAVLPEISLSNVQELVFCQSWQGKAYLEIASSSDYDADYLKDVGYRLWNMLSKELEERVTKNNFRSVFRRHYQRVQQARNSSSTGTVPQIAPEMLLQSIDSAMDSFSSQHDWGQAPDVSLFEGRTSELDKLQEWIFQDQCRLVGLFGVAGVGKTSLAVKLAEQLRDSFDCVIWRSLRNAPSFDEFSADLIRTVAHNAAVTIPDSPDSRISLLIDYLRQYRCLLVLDGWVSLLHYSDEHLAGSYRQGYEHYGQLLRCIGESRHQSSVIITSREKPIGMVFMEGEALPVRTLRLAGLSRHAAMVVLRSLGLNGSNDCLETLIKRYAANPLALKAITRTIIDLFDGNIPKFLEHGPIVYGDLRNILDQQLRRLSLPERQVMVHLAEKQIWTSFVELGSGLDPVLPQEKLLEALESLHRRSLILRKANTFTQLDMIREYVLTYLCPTLKATAVLSE